MTICGLPYGYISLTEDDICELVFAPPYISSFVSNMLTDQGFVRNNIITAEGIEYYRQKYLVVNHPNISEGRVQMVFVFDVTNVSTGSLILKLNCTPPKNIKFEHNRSQRLRLLDSELAQCVSDLEHAVNHDLISINFAGDLSGEQMQFLNSLHSNVPPFANLKIPPTNNPASIAKKVFISYVRLNSPAIDKICKEFQKNSIEYWLDRNNIDPGKFWKDAIKNAIKNGAFFLACFSAEYASKAETHMNEEIILAVEQLRLKQFDSGWFIPIKLSKCDIPDIPIMAPRTLNDIQAVMLYENWEDGIRRIVEVIKKT